MKFAVTGSSGRIGRAVVALAIAQGHEVVGIDRQPPDEGGEQNCHFIAADLSDYAAFEQAIAGCQGLIHLAAIPSPRGRPDHEVHNHNVVVSYNALSAAANLGIDHVCLASSVNAIGAAFSRQPRFEYFPLDEKHPTYNEDPYSLSKWIVEQQADSFARRYEQMTIASLRFHAVVAEPRQRTDPTGIWAKQLWGYTRLEAAARACLLAVSADFRGHEVFFIVAPQTEMTIPSLQLWTHFYPDVPLYGDLIDHRGFFSCEKAERLLGWKHDQS